MAPPVLDGASRGWNNMLDDDDEDDCELSGDEGDSAAPPPQQDGSGEYSATNNLLRELHTLNQHRLLFSPPPSKAFHQPMPMPYHTSQEFYPTQSNLHQPPRSLGKFPDRLESPLEKPAGAGDEMAHVLKRYEETNRLLGEVFLSRRRGLDPPTQGQAS
ncbi:hypothetical protein D9611_003245 [Ephemerocybe angulata]|uniref:Uncharacterized protein n=1 Tax=Ephemerocybe angulata TaxID=980116 RepID=A0A8H5C9M3_9AGAR|nr:hypothetical protein D9611_003245 [Tulosesus angulatus]